MLIYAGQQVRAIHGPIFPDPPDHGASIHRFFAIIGEAALLGAPGGRELSTDVWLCDKDNPFTKESLAQYIKQMNAFVGKVADLQISPPDGVGDLYKECLFLGFTKSGHGILKDITGLLGFSAWCTGTLRWRQLTIAYD